MIEGNWGIENSEKYWEKVVKDTDSFYQKYKTEFAKELAVAYLNELERRAKHE